MSGDTFIGQFAGLIKHQKTINIGHHLLIIDTEITLMPSMAFGSCLAQLATGAAASKKDNGKEDNS